MEQVRMVAVTIVSAVMSVLSPVNNFLLALMVAWGFNVLAGMRSDGIMITNCSKFSIRKFSDSIVQLVLYVCVLCGVQMVMYLCGDCDKSVYVVKTATYIFIYVWVCNGFKNLIRAYPKAKGLIIVYLLLRLDFKKIAPQHVQDVIDAYERHEINNKEKKE